MFKKVIVILVLAVTVYACSSSSEDNPVKPDTFDRGALLTHLADNVIIPSFEGFKTKMDALKTVANTFTTSPNQTNLEALRTAWLNAYKEWQYVEMFNIGKAEELQYRFYMNVYPITVVDVETNITSGSYDLNNVNNHDAQGFPALDYLLYGVANDDTTIVAKYTTDANATGYKKYITDVVNQMSSLTTTVLNDWKTSYRNQFVSSTSNTGSSALNKLVNDFIYYYEKGLRANKFGIPAGVFSSTPLPEKVEGLYSKTYSKTLALEALKAFKDFFIGKYKGNANANRSSLQQYLEALDRKDIADAVLNQLAVAKTKITSINDNFYQQVTSDNSQMLKSYDELQKVVALFKVDMLQAFNISIDYVDADGD